MLRDRFDRDLTVEIDWEEFLAHPEVGGNRLYPLYVGDTGMRYLIYALTRWMKSDEEFRESALALVRGLRVTSAPDVESREVRLEGGTIVYRCFADMSLDGYFTLDELQMLLPELIE